MLASQSLPKCINLDGINFQMIPWLEKCSWKLFKLQDKKAYNLLIYDFAPIKLVALSEHIMLGLPLRATNLQKTAKKDSVDKSFASSICIAFVTKQMNKQM